MSSESDADDAPRKSSSGNTSSHVGNDDEDDSDEDDDASIDVEPRQNAGDDRLPPMHTVVVNPFDTVMPPGMDVGGGVMSSMPTLRNGVATIGAITTFTPTMTTLNTAPTAAGSSAPGSSPSRKPDRRRENDRRCTTCNITFETPVMLVAHLKVRCECDVLCCVVCCFFVMCPLLGDSHFFPYQSDISLLLSAQPLFLFVFKIDAARAKFESEFVSCAI